MKVKVNYTTDNEAEFFITEDEYYRLRSNHDLLVEYIVNYEKEVYGNIYNKDDINIKPHMVRNEDLTNVLETITIVHK